MLLCCVFIYSRVIYIIFIARTVADAPGDAPVLDITLRSSCQQLGLRVVLLGGHGEERGV